MRSVIISKDGLLALTTGHSKPSPKQNHVLVRTRAFAVNSTDIFPGNEERTTGIECVGMVEDAGGVKGLRVGQTVAVIDAAGGLWQDFVLVPAKNVIPLRVTPPTPGSPLDTPTWSKLAAIPLTFITAFGILDTLDLRHGEVLLIRGGTSSIGLAICTVAKCIGAMVASTTRDPTNAPNLSDNGADYVILEREGGIKDDVRMMFPARDISGPTDEFASAPVNRDIAGADKCVDLIGTPSTLLDSLQALKAPGGIYCIAGTLGGTAVIPLFDPLSQIPSGVMITTFSTDKIDLQRVPLQQIVDRCLERGQYRISLDRTFLIEDVDKVAGYIREGKSRGKVVVVVNDELS